MVRIRTLRAISVPTKENPNNIIEPGRTVEVSEEQAKEFCDRHFEGGRAYVGERYNDDPRNNIVRAERVA